MKVLTLTTQYANNYGALLQCYALSKYLNNQQGIDCKVIDYLPEGYERSWKILKRPNSFKGFLKTIYSLTQFSFIREKHAKNRVMKLFIDKYIPLDNNKCDRKAILAYPPQGDVYVCGSDQIWNRNIFHDLTYFLDFVQSGKRVSYAASVADPWDKDFENTVKPILQSFNRISLREKGNIPQVKSLVKDKEIEWVIDPVFLLGREGWDEIVKEPSVDEPYIFCYFLNVDPISVKVVNKLRQQTGYKVINLALDALDKFHSDKVVRVADPCEFVGYIKKASYICTNSFHCSAFSTIYKKRFAFIPKSWANERLISLQEIFGIDVIMNNDKFEHLVPEMLEINYDNDNNKSEEFIGSSKQFLLNAIYE